MPKQRKLIWLLYPSYVFMVVVALAIVLLYMSGVVKQFYLHATEQQLEAQARLFRELADDRFATDDSGAMDALCKMVGTHLATRITVITSAGIVIGDSEENPADMDNHADRPEIRAALVGQVGKSTRYSHTLRHDMLYVALPVTRANHVGGIVRAAISVEAIDRMLNSMYRKSAVGGIMVSLIAAVISFFVSNRINTPIQELTRGARRFADGDLQHRLHISGSQEIATLAEALNRMTSQLRDRIDTVTRQRGELETVLGSMIEAVVVVDSEERIVRCNQAAIGLFGLTAKHFAQRNIQESIRNIDIDRFVKATLTGAKPVEAEVVMNSDTAQFLHAHGTLLRTPDGGITGAVLVFHDMTRLKHLENMRREFVANVSHELKTPITSISGFVETLQDGAINDPDNAPRFLEIIARNAKRLTTIIEDLLSLSRIEQDEEHGQISLARKLVKPVLDGAIMACVQKAQDKNVQVELRCDDGTAADMNAELLEQALVNLLDNAIKYSDPQSVVAVRVTSLETGVSIAVTDTGCGIPREHLPRLFERFYRVDKARSRKLGGTGLGLAIVKHIVQAHRGLITVESTPGKGSTFTITLP